MTDRVRACIARPLGVNRSVLAKNLAWYKTMPYIAPIITRKGMLYLLDVYAKSAKEDLTDAEKREIRNLIAALEAES